MIGYGRCVRLSARSARWEVIGWPAAVAGLVATTAATLSEMYPAQAGRDAYAAAYRAMSGSAALQGRGYDLATLGGMLANEMGYLTLILLPLVGLHLAIRLTRGVEDTGRLELLTAQPINRLAPAAAGITVAAAAAALAAIASAGSLILLGYPAAGSGRYGAALGVFMLAYTALGALVAQCCRNARTAYGVGVAVWLATYLTRALGDARGWDAVWVNPQSWLAEVRPFAGEPPLWPWVAFGVLVSVALAAAAAVAVRRDLGAGIITPRPGPVDAARWVRSPLALLVRLTVGLGSGWCVAGALFAFAFGYLTPQMSRLDAATSVGQNPAVDTTLAVFVQMNALLAAAAGAQLAQWLAREETTGRTGLGLAAPVSRRRWWSAATVLVVGWAAALLVVTAMFTGLGLSAGFGDLDHTREGVTATLAYGPAVLLIAVTALALHAVAPAAVVGSWLLVGWGIVVSLRADLLRIPEWARHLSPLEWLGAVPVDSWQGTAGIGMTVLSVGLAVAAAVVFRHRDLAAG
jgi:ABC-2 type transport system permease protein